MGYCGWDLAGFLPGERGDCPPIFLLAAGAKSEYHLPDQIHFMTVYIIRERRQLQLYAVAADHRALFLARKGRRILTWGDSLPQAVARLPLPQKLAVLRELSKK